MSISGGTTDFTNPLDVAVDGSGNVWVTNYEGASDPSSPQYMGGSVTELTRSSNYAPTSAVNIGGAATGFNGAKLLAIDPSGNIWVTSAYGGNSVTELTRASGYSAKAAVVISGGNANLDGPSGIAVDPAGDVWIANILNNTVTELPYSVISAPGATGTSIADNAINISGGNTNFSLPTIVAVDASGNVWVTNLGTAILSQGSSSSGSGGGSITELTKASNYAPGSAVNITGWDGDVLPFDIAADPAGNLWITGVAAPTTAGGSATPLVTELTKASNYSAASALNITGWEGTSTTGSTQQVDLPFGLAIDGGGNVWITNLGLTLNSTTQQVTGSSNITEFTKASNYSASGAVTYSGSAAGFNIPIGIAIDSSGDVWVANSGVGLTGGQIGAISSGSSVTELVQAAVPATTPLP